jgi:hypothetical protein
MILSLLKVCLMHINMYFYIQKQELKLQKQFSPTTHIRNFLSASAFSLANGTLFTNPKLVTDAMAKAHKNCTTRS